MDSNPLKSNMPVACWQNQCEHWFSPYRFPSESGQSNPPSPYCATSFAGGSFAGGEKRVDSNSLKSNMPVACWPDCQNSLAEFAASAAKRIRSFSAGACTWQKIHLRLQVWNLFAYGEQIMRAADCKNWRKSPKGFFDKLRSPLWYSQRGFFTGFARIAPDTVPTDRCRRAG